MSIFSGEISCEALPVTLTPISGSTAADLAHESVLMDVGHGMTSTPTPTGSAQRRQRGRKRITTPCTPSNVIVTRSKGGSVDESSPSFISKQKTGKAKKSSRLSCQSSVQIMELPSGSEDSELTDSCDDNECELQTMSRAKKRKRSAQSARQVEPNPEPASGTLWKKDCMWSDGSLCYEPDGIHSFTGNVAVNENVTGLVTPLQFFRYFLTAEIIKLITDQTLLYCTQQCPNSPMVLTPCDTERFIGIALTMSLIKLASGRRYWSNRFRISQIADVMSFNNFGRVKRFLHFSDNMFSSDDKLKKLRTLADKLRDRFRAVPLEQNLSVDEQIIPFKGRHGLKQYLPKKPHKWGYKVFVLSGVSGYAYDFEIYAGKQDNILLPGEADCGASGNVVIRLSRIVPNNCNFRIFFDNYFTSVDLQLALARRGILSLGTVRLNRLPKTTKLLSDAELAKRGRGAYQEKITSVDGTQLSVVRWYDNRAISLLSTFVGSQPVSEIKRYNKVRHEEQQVPCPQVVHVYNKHMGGVDLLDSLIGLYRNKIRSRKWYHRVFFHLIDLTVVNAWLLYRRSFPGKCKMLSLHDFKADVAEGLCKQGKDESSKMKRGRPSTSAMTVKRRMPGLTPQPSSDVRYDGVGHWPEWRQVRAMCRYDGCKCVSRVICCKCRVSLCHNPKKDCFFEYHHG